MNDLSEVLHSLAHQVRSLSMGMKLIVVCGLALLMAIPRSLSVAWWMTEHSARPTWYARSAAWWVGSRPSSARRLRSRTTFPRSLRREFAKHGIYLVYSPPVLLPHSTTATEERNRSLFKVPVFRRTCNFDAAFDLTGVPAAAPQGAELDWSRAEVVVGVSDARGALSDATLTMGGKTSTLAPAAIAPDIMFNGDQNDRTKLTLFGSRVDVKPGAQFTVSSALRFSGAQRIAVLAYGKTTHLPSRAIGRVRDSTADFCPSIGR